MFLVVRVLFVDCVDAVFDIAFDVVAIVADMCFCLLLLVVVVFWLLLLLLFFLIVLTVAAVAYVVLLLYKKDQHKERINESITSNQNDHLSE